MTAGSDVYARLTALLGSPRVPNHADVTFVLRLVKGQQTAFVAARTIAELEAGLHDSFGTRSGRPDHVTNRTNATSQPTPDDGQPIWSLAPRGHFVHANVACQLVEIVVGRHQAWVRQWKGQCRAGRAAHAHPRRHGALPTAGRPRRHGRDHAGIQRLVCHGWRRHAIQRRCLRAERRVGASGGRHAGSEASLRGRSAGVVGGITCACMRGAFLRLASGPPTYVGPRGHEQPWVGGGPPQSESLGCCCAQSTCRWKSRLC